MKKFIFASAIALMMTVVSCETKNAETTVATENDSTLVVVDSTSVNTNVADSVLVDSVAE